MRDILRHDRGREMASAIFTRVHLSSVIIRREVRSANRGMLLCGLAPRKARQGGQETGFSLIYTQ